MKIIEIKQTRSGGELAYILDEQRGRVIKVLVEDYTREENRPDYPEDDNEAEEEIEMPKVRTIRKKTAKREIPPSEDPNMPYPIPEEQKGLLKQPKSIIPAGMAQMFQEPPEIRRL